jgi:prepilin-type N-terminal cleavage/methylation domain-containing protein
MKPRWDKTGQPSPRRPGFTLVEVIFVMVLLAIVSAMAIPRYANFLAHHRAEAAANRIATDLALAQRQAKFSSTARTVTFNVAAESYTLVGIAHPDHPSQPYVVALSDEPYAAAIVSADFGGDSTVIFNG